MSIRVEKRDTGIASPNDAPISVLASGAEIDGYTMVFDSTAYGLGERARLQEIWFEVASNRMLFRLYVSGILRVDEDLETVQTDQRWTIGGNDPGAYLHEYQSKVWVFRPPGIQAISDGWSMQLKSKSGNKDCEWVRVVLDVP